MLTAFFNANACYARRLQAPPLCGLEDQDFHYSLSAAYYTNAVCSSYVEKGNKTGHVCFTHVCFSICLEDIL